MSIFNSTRICWANLLWRFWPVVQPVGMDDPAGAYIGPIPRRCWLMKRMQSPSVEGKFAPLGNCRLWNRYWQGTWRRGSCPGWWRMKRYGMPASETTLTMNGQLFRQKTFK